jgi:hypothetical protein
MSYSIANTRISSRFKQMIVLIAAIVIGMLVSASLNAIPSSKQAAPMKAAHASAYEAVSGK